MERGTRLKLAATDLSYPNKRTKVALLGLTVANTDVEIILQQRFGALRASKDTPILLTGGRTVPQTTCLSPGLIGTVVIEIIVATRAFVFVRTD